MLDYGLKERRGHSANFIDRTMECWQNLILFFFSPCYSIPFHSIVLFDFHSLVLRTHLIFIVVVTETAAAASFCLNSLSVCFCLIFRLPHIIFDLCVCQSVSVLILLSFRFVHAFTSLRFVFILFRFVDFYRFGCLSHYILCILFLSIFKRMTSFWLEWMKWNEEQKLLVHFQAYCCVKTFNK